MLVGPPYQSAVPAPPDSSVGIGEIVQYLQGLRDAIVQIRPDFMADTIGMAGVQGFSATGVAASNLRGIVSIPAGSTSATATFVNLEQNASYFLALGVHPGTSAPNAVLSARYSNPTTTGFLITVSGDPTPGFVMVDWILIR